MDGCRILTMRLAIQNAIATLRAAERMPITAARTLIGIFFCISGGTKLLVPAQFAVVATLFLLW